MLDARNFWYLRHGETDWNRQGLSQGRTDIALNETGKKQAHVAGKILQDRAESIMPIVRIVSSPLGRALTTAQVVASYISSFDRRVEVTVDPDLQEVCFGEQEGCPMGDWYDSWIAGDFTPKGAETFSELMQRAVAAVNRATEGEGAVLIVAHGALFRALRAAMKLPANVRLPNAVPLVVEAPLNEAGSWTLQHLE
jgi:probable phosphoglycerate mutase